MLVARLRTLVEPASPLIQLLFRRQGADRSGRKTTEPNQRTKKMMNLKKKLQNPMVLVAQGFVAGAILFHATTPPEAVPAQPQQATSQALEKIVEA
jgi:hypothetical protein